MVAHLTGRGGSVDDAARVAERAAKAAALLASDKPGEVVAAAAATVRLLAALGLDFATVVRRGIAAPPPRPMPQPSTAPTRWQPTWVRLAWLRQHDRLLTAWERGFAASLERQVAPMTERQRTVLDDVIARVAARGAR